MGDRTRSSKNGKTPLKPGYSQLHWMLLTQRHDVDLSDGARREFANKGVKVTRAQVQSHNQPDDCWMILQSKVYNVTPYLLFHPGGTSTLMRAAGQDCTNLFMENHRWVNGHGMLEACYIGELQEEEEEEEEHEDEESGRQEQSMVALHPVRWRSFQLAALQKDVCDRTIRLSFELPRGKTLGLTMAGQHVKFRANINGAVVEREYTPISRLNQLGSVDFLVRVYETGRMSPFLRQLKVGQSVEMTGPHGSFGYVVPKQLVKFSNTPNQKWHSNVVHSKIDLLVLLAAGSGITPFLQILRSIFESSKDEIIQVLVIYSNPTLGEAMALEQLEPLENLFPQRFALHQVISCEKIGSQKPNGGSSGSCTYGQRLDGPLLESILSKSPFQRHFSGGSNNSSVVYCHCGPESYDQSVHKALIARGVDEKHIIGF